MQDNKKSNAINRFISKVRFSKGCWLWTGWTEKTNGYGKFWYEGRNWGAHRVSLILFRKIELTKNDIVCHLCNNPPCVNPKHLIVGNSSTNNIMSQRYRINRVMGGKRLIPLYDSEKMAIFPAKFPSTKLSMDSPVICINCGFKGNLKDVLYDGLSFMCPICENRELDIEKWWVREILNEEVPF